MQELDDRARPAVRKQERRGVGTAARRVDEMQLDAAQACRELTKAIYARFLRAPVEAIAPVRYKLTQVVAARAGRPHGQRRLVRKARARHPLAQIGKGGLRHLKREWTDEQFCRQTRSPRLICHARSASIFPR